MTAEQMALAARNTGFTGDGLMTIVAISGAEASFEDETANTARPDRPFYRPLTAQQISMGWQPEYSVGPLMIDLEQHGNEISEAAARTFEGAARWAFGASSQGTNFSPWSTYTGAGLAPGQPAPYLAYIDTARLAVANTQRNQELVSEYDMPGYGPNQSKDLKLDEVSPNVAFVPVGYEPPSADWPNGRDVYELRVARLK